MWRTVPQKICPPSVDIDLGRCSSILPSKQLSHHHHSISTIYGCSKTGISAQGLSRRINKDPLLIMNSNRWQWGNFCVHKKLSYTRGGVLPYKRLIGMCRWMGVAFSRLDWPKWGRIFNRVTRMGSHIFGFLGVRQFFIFAVSKHTRMFVLQMKSKMFFSQSKKWANS